MSRLQRVTDEEWEERKDEVREYLKTVDENPYRSNEIKANEVAENTSLSLPKATATIQRMDCIEDSGFTNSVCVGTLYKIKL